MRKKGSPLTAHVHKHKDVLYGAIATDKCTHMGVAIAAAAVIIVPAAGRDRSVTCLQGQQAQQQQALEAELAALRAQHRAETVRLQELNDQAQEALQQSMQRLLKLKGKLEAEKDARKRLEEQQQLEKASLEERCHCSLLFCAYPLSPLLAIFV